MYTLRIAIHQNVQSSNKYRSFVRETPIWSVPNYCRLNFANHFANQKNENIALTLFSVKSQIRTHDIDHSRHAAKRTQPRINIYMTEALRDIRVHSKTRNGCENHGLNIGPNDRLKQRSRGDRNRNFKC